MKIGMRTPSPTRSVKAKTTGRLNRAVKKSVNPVYGRKGVGYIKDPERAIKNKIYHKVTYDPLKSMKNADWPDLEPAAKPSSISLAAILSPISIIASIYFVYKLLVHNEFHIIPVAIIAIYLVIFFISKKHEN